jgi:quinolinate synthase
LIAGSVVNEIEVEPEIAKYSMIALERMLEVK